MESTLRCRVSHVKECFPDGSRTRGERDRTARIRRHGITPLTGGQGWARASLRPTGYRLGVDMRLEVVPIPVVDIDRAKTFYAEKVGFSVDHDVRPTDGVRVVQLTPSGSACSIVLAQGLPGFSAEPGSIRGLHLIVDDIDAARSTLVDRGVAVDEVADLGGGVRMAGFSDPDGNTWALQELP